MSEVSYLLRRGNRSSRLVVAHLGRAIIYYFRALALVPGAATANVQAFLSAFTEAILGRRQNPIRADRSGLAALGHWMLLALSILLRPFILVASVIIRVLVFVGAFAFVVMAFGGGLVILVLFGVQLFELLVAIVTALNEVDSALRALPKQELSGWQAEFFPYLRHYGIFAILVPLVGAVISLVLSIVILKLLITLVRAAWYALLALGNAIRKAIRSARQFVIGALRELTWRQALLLSTILSGCAVIALAFRACVQSDACRNTAPWVIVVGTCVVLLAVIVKLLTAIDIKRGEGGGFSLEVFNCSIISKSKVGITILGISLVQISWVSISVLSLGVATIASWQYGPDLLHWARAGIEPPAVVGQAPEPPEPEEEHDPPIHPPTLAADSNLFLSPAYWRMGSALELTNKSGRPIELTDIFIDEEALCDYAFIVAVGAASPDGTELLNAYFSRQRARLTALVARGKSKHCEEYAPIIAYSLGESVTGVSTIEARRLLAFGVRDVAESELSVDVLNQLVSGFMTAAANASIDDNKALQPEYCLYDNLHDRPSTFFRFALETCGARW